MGFLSKIGNGFRRTGMFFRDSGQELKKVRWPNRKEMVSYTLVVLGTVLFVVIYFAIVDYGLSFLVDLIFGD